jgi:hypothetical protein
MTPRRIQRRRLLGWRKPKGAIYVGRGSRWGNPIKVGKDSVIRGDLGGMEAEMTLLADTPQQAVDLYRRYVTTGLVDPLGVIRFRSPIAQDIRRELAERDLMCWCPLGQPCHADVLLEIANGGDPS